MPVQFSSLVAVEGEASLRHSEDSEGRKRSDLLIIQRKSRNGITPFDCRPSSHAREQAVSRFSSEFGRHLVKRALLLKAKVPRKELHKLVELLFPRTCLVWERVLVVLAVL